MPGTRRGIVFDEIDEYIDGLAARGDDALQAVERQGHAEGWPIVGAAEGSLLHILARGIQARRILELGTAIGYSGTWLARALPEEGELVTVEGDPETAEIARKNFEKTGVASRVTILVGIAQDVLSDLKGPFDYIFNDIDKEGYPIILPHLIERLRLGGLLLTDNVLKSGRVATQEEDRSLTAVRKYNVMLKEDPRMQTVILPLRDGLSVALRVR